MTKIIIIIKEDIALKKAILLFSLVNLIEFLLKNLNFLFNCSINIRRYILLCRRKELIRYINSWWCKNYILSKKD